MEKRVIDYDSFVTFLKSIEDNDTIFNFFLYALEKENFSICEALLDAGVSVNITREKPKESLIHELISKETINDKILDFLLDNGADINLKGSLGTPLHYACGKSNVNIAKYLISKGAKVTNNIQSGNSIITDLHIAVYMKNFELVELLLENGAIAEERFDDVLGNPLSIAVDNNDIKIVGLLLKYGASPNFYLSDRTLLHKAVLNGDKEMARVLLENDADVNAKFEIPTQAIREFNGGSTPMDIALYDKDEKMQKLLLKYGGKASSDKEKLNNRYKNEQAFLKYWEK